MQKISFLVLGDLTRNWKIFLFLKRMWGRTKRQREDDREKRQKSCGGSRKFPGKQHRNMLLFLFLSHFKRVLRTQGGSVRSFLRKCLKSPKIDFVFLHLLPNAQKNLKWILPKFLNRFQSGSFKNWDRVKQPRGVWAGGWVGRLTELTFPYSNFEFVSNYIYN